MADDYHYHAHPPPEHSTMASFDQPGGLGLAPEDQVFANPDVKWSQYARSMRLGRLTVMAMIVNRMIGTGIFRTPAKVYLYTESVSISMLWWTLGVIVAMSGILVYMELGLTLPLYTINKNVISVPRSGGELNYLKYIFDKPLYFVVTVFGIAFVLIGNVATNSIAFGLSVLDAAGKSDVKNRDEVVRAIAITMVAFSCLLHGIWRQGGIYLNNILACLKILILVMMFLLGILAHSGVFQKAEGVLSSSSGFAGAKPDAYGYAEAFLSILFAIGGFNQANYVIGEVDDPRKRYKWPAFSAVLLVTVLYILVNIAYFIVVPAADFTSNITDNVAHSLFELTLGTIKSPWAPHAPKLLSALMALSSLGNIVVFTYTAARVKQEIAKEGILPFRRFFANSVRTVRIPLRELFGSKLKTLYEEIPLGALILHFFMSVLLILGTWSLTANDTYGVLVDLYSYSIDAIFGVCVGYGLLYMRLTNKHQWKTHSANSGFAVNHVISIICAFIFGTANLYPVAAKFVPPNTKVYMAVPWFTTGAVGWSILAAGVIWWIGFRFVVPHIGQDHKGRYRLLTRKVWLHSESTYKVLEYEDIVIRWVPKDEDEERQEGANISDLREREPIFATDAELESRLRSDGREF